MKQKKNKNIVKLHCQTKSSPSLMSSEEYETLKKIYLSEGRLDKVLSNNTQKTKLFLLERKNHRNPRSVNKNAIYSPSVVMSKEEYQKLEKSYSSSNLLKKILFQQS